MSLPDLKDKQRNPPTHAKMGGVLLHHLLLLSVSAPDACSLSGQSYIPHFPHPLCLSVARYVFSWMLGDWIWGCCLNTQNTKCVQDCDWLGVWWKKRTHLKYLHEYGNKESEYAYCGFTIIKSLYLDSFFTHIISLSFSLIFS